MKKKIRETPLHSGILGAITGDAMGVPHEFTTPEQVKNRNLENMTGYGTYHQPPGTWSDDTSMTLATMDSLTRGVNYEDVMNKFTDWITLAKYTPHGEVFDYGNTTYKALMRYPLYNPLECGLSWVRDNGNGSLMRILPVSYYCYYKQLTTKEQIHLIDDFSSLTHAHPISKASCNIYNFIIQEILHDKEEGKHSLSWLIEEGLQTSEDYYPVRKYPFFNHLYSELLSEDVCGGSKGYVLDSLETAIHTSYHTQTYEQSIIETISYGKDTDTNAMITGGITGLYYGLEHIPSRWLNKLVKLEEISHLCDEYYKSLTTN